MGSLPQLFLTRHGETPWSLTGQHTGRTDVPLTARGEEQARRLGERLRSRSYSRVLTSPLQRAKRTCDLAGFLSQAASDDDLVEWDYGEFTGKTFAEIRALQPGWELFRDGCPGGEGPADVGNRADRVIAKTRQTGGDVLLFSSGHFLRMLAARWLSLDPSGGRCFHLSTASLSILGPEPATGMPIVLLWNDVGHLKP